MARELRELGELPTDDDWSEHADVHHGALLSFCCRAGAHVGDADLATITAMGRYGRHVGRMWTLADDLVGISGDEPLEFLQDRARAGRPSHPVVVAAAEDHAVGLTWLELVRRPDDRSTAIRLLDGIHSTHAVQAGREAMLKESWSARQALRLLPPSPYRTGLDDLAAGLAKASA